MVQLLNRLVQLSGRISLAVPHIAVGIHFHPYNQDTKMLDPSRLREINPAKMGLSLFDEFKAFAFKGNVVDLAVGVIIGTAFGGIVNSLVKNIIMPLISVLFPGDQSYTTWKWVINNKDVPYGLFLGEVVNFLIVSIALFIFIVKFLGWLMKLRKKEDVATVPALTKEQVLLTEIRDLLASRNER